MDTASSFSDSDALFRPPPPLPPTPPRASSLLLSAAYMQTLLSPLLSLRFRKHPKKNSTETSAGAGRRPPSPTTPSTETASATSRVPATSPSLAVSFTPLRVVARATPFVSPNVFQSSFSPYATVAAMGARNECRQNRPSRPCAEKGKCAACCGLHCWKCVRLCMLALARAKARGSAPVIVRPEREDPRSPSVAGYATLREPIVGPDRSQPQQQPSIVSHIFGCHPPPPVSTSTRAHV